MYSRDMYVYAMWTVYKYTGYRLRPIIPFPLFSFAICNMTITQWPVAGFDSRDPTAGIEDISLW